MILAKDKFEFYHLAKSLLLEKGFKVNPYREIQYGLQFMVFDGGSHGLVRIYEGKKGLRLDLSQVEDEELYALLGAHLQLEAAEPTRLIPFKQESVSVEQVHFEQLDELIGIDESGKGDYFGPLVVAGVYVNKAVKKELRLLGVADSKTLSDDYIREIAPQIKALCPHSLVIMGNSSYNEVYDKIKNLNHVLAWGHARVLENVLNQQPCPYALSDQFGQVHLIENALLNKGREITVYQRPKAEVYLAVAAASILAREAFVSAIQEMESFFQMRFPKGSSAETLRAAKVFSEKFGSEKLNQVTKLHFKLTDQLETL